MDTSVSETSRQAFDEAIRPRLNSLHTRVLDAVRARGNATVSEVAVDTGIFHHTVQNRVSELRTLGALRALPETRRNERNRSETVLELV